MVITNDDLITVREASRESRRTAETVRWWIWEGKLPAQKMGNQLFIRRKDLENIIASVRVNNSVSRIATFGQVRVARERIGRRLRGTFNVLEALDKSRESHP